MIEVKSYRDLTVWPKSMDAAVSIPANIADGNVEIIWVIISVQNSIA